MRSSLALIALLSLVVGACNCNKTPPAVETALKAVGEPCAQDTECTTGLCASIPGEASTCRKTCESGCGTFEICTTFGVASGGKTRAGCVPERPGLCAPCTTNADCPYPADTCLSLGGAKFCGRDCAGDGQCPDGYVCADGTGVDGFPATKQCQPKSATCECLASNAGQMRPCKVTNTFGTCVGVETCDAVKGYTACDAKVPAKEVCNGSDDDCNGKVDDGLADLECGVGECHVKVAACSEGHENTCAPLPQKAEACNGKDDDCDGTIDNGFDLTSDVKNCGVCNTVCTVSNGTPECRASKCAVQGCSPGFADCDGKYDTGCEVNTVTDVNNCGGCGKVCVLDHASAVCTSGKCAVQKCAPGFVDRNNDPADGCEYACTQTNNGVEKCDGIDNDCNGKADDGFDLTSDILNCGACGRVCTVLNGAPACVNGNCVIASCNRGFGDCDGQYGSGCETNTETSSANCGGCGKACAPSNASGQCISGACGVKTCNTGFDDCNGLPGDGCEVDLRSDAKHCGGCGNVCSVTNGGPGCANGACTVLSCNPPFGDCDGKYSTGCETNKDTDVLNCGACGKQCPARPNATTSCASGNCGFSCTGSFQDCNGQAVDGCESDKLTDPDHCGSCSTTCPARANAARTCTNGGCGFLCSGNFQNCDGVATNGCESDKTADVKNCGACGNACLTRPNSTPTCTGAGCGYACTGTYQDCDGQAANGCESDKTADVKNCGACNNACPARPNATAVCTPTGCSYVCNAGFLDCNGQAVDGCEAPKSNDPANCGGCGTVCATRPNSTPSCTATGCGYTCTTGFQDCNAVATDGCESTKATDPANCGSCGNACPAPANATATCASSTCGFACKAGFQNCDGSAANGCESNKAADVLNCGSCGNACPARPHAQPTCGASGCGYTCDPGYADCNGQAVDGCEADIGSDVDHCGTCATACPAAANAARTCTAGKCGYACNAGFNDCDGSATNGCESNKATDARNCGSCGNACAAVANAAPVCTSGVCNYSCNSGFNDCDGLVSNGCESNKNTDVKNCGACNNACASRPNATTTCGSGICGYSCTSPYQDCNGLVTDGCESNKLSDVNNCGACGTRCSAKTNASGVCASGSCGIACSSGYADCNSTTTDGCERTLNNNGTPPTCGTVTDLGDIDGDQGAMIFNRTNFNEGTFKVRVWERDTSYQIYISSTIKLVSPSTIDYDLYVYTLGCGTSVSQATNGGAGGTETMNVCACDRSGVTDYFDVWFEVVYKSGTGCTNWGITVTGNTVVDICETGGALNCTNG